MPAQIAAGTTPEIQVLGNNFFASAGVDLNSRKDVSVNTSFQIHVGDLAAQEVHFWGVHKLTFMAPVGLVPGLHSLTVETPHGKRAILERAITVLRPELPGSGGTGGKPNLTFSGSGGVTNTAGGSRGTMNTGSSSSTSGGATNTTGGSRGTGTLPGCIQQTYGPSTFLFCPDQFVNWDEARALCQSLNMDLPRINSAAENNFVLMGMQAAQVDYIWLGANDRTAEGSWCWLNGDPLWTGEVAGMPVGNAYTNWDAGQPDNNSPLAKGEDCALLQEDITVAFWADHECSRRFTGLGCQAIP
ncbi:MAG: C-type lectin domain-containing protein [Polyangiaceae bacterium]|nr:C-type lectin domain-containing protein [Polyangiaceae bacterium]